MANILKFPGYDQGDALDAYNYVNVDKYLGVTADGAPGIENGSSLFINLIVPGSEERIQKVLWQIGKVTWSDELVDKVDKAIRENSRVPNTILDMEELISGIVSIDNPGSCGLIDFSTPLPADAKN